MKRSERSVDDGTPGFSCPAARLSLVTFSHPSFSPLCLQAADSNAAASLERTKPLILSMPAPTILSTTLSETLTTTALTSVVMKPRVTGPSPATAGRIGTMNLASAGPPRVRVDSLGAWKVSAPEGCRTARTAASPGARSTARSSARGSVALPRVAGCCATIASSVSAPSGMKSGGRPGTTDPTARPLVVPRTVQSREYDLIAICVYLGSPLMVTLQTAEPNNGHSPNRGTNAKGDALAGHQ